MENISLHKRFGDILDRLFKNLGFVVKKEVIQTFDQQNIVLDFFIERQQRVTIVEVKFYRTKHGTNGAVRKAAEQLLKYTNFQLVPVSSLLIVSSYVSLALKDELWSNYRIKIWDRSDIYSLIKLDMSDAQILEDLENLLNEAQQGIDTENVFADVVINDKTLEQYLEFVQEPIKFLKEIKTPKVKDYCTELNAIVSGQAGWRNYEDKCIEILRYLFSNDLDNWDSQRTTDDELSRFDMVCRIVSKDDFWRSLVQSFHSRYILFEFKNYRGKIGQDQIYTTERYLYLRGLRSVAFIIAKNGGSPQAVKASKGALREHGKLILILDNEDLCKMIAMKNEGRVPSDYLSQKLDEFLIKLSR